MLCCYNVCIFRYIDSIFLCSFSLLFGIDGCLSLSFTAPYDTLKHFGVNILWTNIRAVRIYCHGFGHTWWILYFCFALSCVRSFFFFGYCCCSFIHSLFRMSIKIIIIYCYIFFPFLQHFVHINYSKRHFQRINIHFGAHTRSIQCLQHWS